MIQHTHNYKAAFILGICVSTFGLIMFWIYRYLMARPKEIPDIVLEVIEPEKGDECGQNA